MGRHSVFRLYESALPAGICDCIVTLGSEFVLHNATLAATDEKVGNSTVDRSIRDTNIAFWDPGHWISGLLVHYASLANHEIWGYSLTISQGVQFGVYGVGGKYDWHKDEFDQPFGEEAPPAWQGLSRKISVVANLSDPGDYEGGELCFLDTYGKVWEDSEMSARMRQRGSVVVFPAYINHTVKPVTSGVRRSIVSWILGPPFQ